MFAVSFVAVAGMSHFGYVKCLLVLLSVNIIFQFVSQL